MFELLDFTSPLMFAAGGLGEVGTRWAANIGLFGGALVSVALIISIIIDAFGYVKGSGSNSIGKIVGKVIFLIVMIGIIAIASSQGFSDLGKNAAEKGKGVANSAVQDI